MSAVFHGADAAERATGLTRAAAAVRRGDLVVIPTDSAYGVGCDAFSVPAVRALRAAKGRGPDLAVPVLIGSLRTLEGIAAGLPPDARLLAQGWWPGPLTLICRAQPTLTWDLGSGSTVAVRMPLHPLALELLRATGPMAVVAANRAGTLPPATCEDARRQLGIGGVDLPRRRRLRRPDPVDRGGRHRAAPGAGPARGGLGRGAARRRARSGGSGGSRMTEPMGVTVLHVCMGNICRSPMAERLMRHRLDEAFGAAAAEVRCAGAGTYGGHAGEGMNPPAARVLAEQGVDPSAVRGHRPAARAGAGRRPDPHRDRRPGAHRGPAGAVGGPAGLRPA